MVNTQDVVTIEIEPGSELARALRAVDRNPVVIVSDGVRYEVNRAGGERDTDDDREAFRAALRAAAGVFTPEEADRLKQDIYRWREEGSKPPIWRDIPD
jgi:hypothetical protein